MGGAVLGSREVKKGIWVVDADTRDELRQALKCAMDTPSPKAALRIANWEALSKHSKKTPDNTDAEGGGGQPKSEFEFKGTP